MILDLTFPRFITCAFLLCIVSLVACVPPSEERFEGIVIDLNDAATQRIYELQNSRNIDSLMSYLRHQNPSYRYQAARAFGSFAELPGNTQAALLENLEDRYELVRSAAAFALGQSGDKSIVNSLAASFDTLGEMAEFNATVLAAIGKLGGEKEQAQVANITTYRPQDTLLRASQVWSLFYQARNGNRTAKGDSIIAERLLNVASPQQVQQAAAFYFQRFPLALTAEQEGLFRARFRSATNPDVLMAIARCLGESKVPESRVSLLRNLKVQEDWRVRVEIIKALGGYAYALVRPDVLERLSDEHPLVRKQAVNFLLEHGDATDAAYYHRFGKDSTRLDIRYQLYGAANRHLPLYLTDYRGRINFDLQQAFAATQDVYEKAQILRSLGEFPWNYRTINDLYREASSPVVRSAAAEALYKISSREDFRAFFRGSANRVRLDLAGFFQEMITSLSVGPAYYAASAISDLPDEYRPLYPDQTWLRSALKAFKLPKEIEAYYAVDAARAALAGEAKPKPQQPNSDARPIDWNVLGEGGQDVQVRTSSGRFSLRMLPEVAPATVTSFLQLAEKGYYDGKVFHRVVPNFVAQGGGPLGDGFGSEDFIVRTETPDINWDRPGLVGMASAGRDTEGVQFFITHRGTPHLNGNYTIFAEVTEGQEVVDQLTVGAKIETIIVR